MAVFALAATAGVVAVPAQASCNTECKEEKLKAKQEAKEAKLREKALAKGIGDPWGVNDFRAYHNCPYENPEISDCFTGVTLGGKKGGFFQYGSVKVALNKRILLQGGFKNVNPNVEVSPAVGAETLAAPLLDVEGGINVITPAIMDESEWPQSLREAFSQAVKNHETGAQAKIELAGTECFDVPDCLNTENLLFEEGTAFRLPLKVKLTAPFLEKLGGGPCYVGSDENPIHINLTTAGQGAAGQTSFNSNFTNIFLHGSRLVDTGWHIPIAAGAQGCGGAYESYVDEALNHALEVLYPGGQSEASWKTGIVVLEGDLHDGNAKTVKKEAELGKV